MLDESSDSSTSSVHNFLSCSLIMDAAVAPNWTAHEVHKDALESFLLARPLTTVKTTKFTANRDKTEYRRCRCKCSYRINIYFPRDESDFYQVRETDIPSDHVDVDENPDTIPKDREVCGMIDNLIQEYKFAKNFGPCRIISHLRSKGIEEGRIPTAKQLQNRLYYFRKCKLQFGNEIGPLEKKLQGLIYQHEQYDEHPLDQPFTFHYGIDQNDRLVLGDGSDDNPFFLSFSSKALLSVVPVAVTSRLSTVLHMDCTFKCNDNEFPLLIIGLSDAQQQFHLLSLSVISHRTEAVYSNVLEHLKKLIHKLYPNLNFSPNYCMTDCEAAERSVNISIFY